MVIAVSFSLLFFFGFIITFRWERIRIITTIVVCITVEMYTLQCRHRLWIIDPEYWYILIASLIFSIFLFPVLLCSFLSVSLLSLTISFFKQFDSLCVLSFFLESFLSVYHIFTFVQQL